MRFDVCLKKETRGRYRRFMESHKTAYGLADLEVRIAKIFIDNILLDHQGEEVFKAKVASTTVHELIHVLERLWKNIWVHALTWTLFEFLDPEMMRLLKEVFVPDFRNSILEIKRNVITIDLDG